MILNSSNRTTFKCNAAMDFNYLYECFLLIAVSMTTVGYGDYHLVTIPGRLIGFVMCGIN